MASVVLTSETRPGCRQSEGQSCAVSRGPPGELATCRRRCVTVRMIRTKLLWRGFLISAKNLRTFRPSPCRLTSTFVDRTSHELGIEMVAIEQSPAKIVAQVVISRVLSRLTRRR